MRHLIIIAFFLLTACASSAIKPSDTLYPPEYLENYPLGQTTEYDMIMKAGGPTRYVEVDGNRAMVYVIGKDYARKKFTYVIDDGRIIDVIYNDNTKWDGMSAKLAQSQTEQKID